jgi:autotransporter-associated beta strand protein
LTKSTANTVTLSGANVYTGTSYVNAGALVIQGAAATAAVLASTATTDISTGQLVFSYSGSSTGASIASQVQSILAASYNGGTNSWASGIIHSTLANTNSTASYALGWTNNTATSTVTVQVALYGDANLDGTVNINDLSKVLGNYNKSGMTWADGDFNYDGTVNINDLSKVLGNYNKSGMTWADGDFNYDGTVNINDLSKVLGNYNKSIDLSGMSISTSEYPNLDGQAIAALEAVGVTVVPEPGTLALLTAGAIGLLGYAWRRRRAM